MTYEKLFYLKYQKGMSTTELINKYPKLATRVSQVALCDISDKVLKEIIEEEDEYLELIQLKRKFAKLIAREEKQNQKKVA